MKLPAALWQLLLFVPYALAVWVTAYHGLRGSDELGLVCALLLIGGAVALVYVRFLRRTVTPGIFSPAMFAALGLLGLALGTMSSGEAVVGVVAGLVVGGGAAAAAAVSAARRRRRPRTLFLSYRRADSGDITPRIRERLAERFGTKNIFMDVTSIDLGGRFRTIIDDAVNHSDALIAVIGDEWLTIADEQGGRRLDAEDDLVRIEIETALRNDKVLVVPLAVHGADIPEAADLPASIRDLAGRNGGVVRSGSDFDADMQHLIQGLEQGSVTPWSRAAPAPIRWRRVALMVAILVGPLAWFLLEMATSNLREIEYASLSPDRGAVATAHGSGLGIGSRVRIWDTASGALLQTVGAGGKWIRSIAWAPDGEHVAYGGFDGTLVILGTDDWQERHRFEQHGGTLEQIVWSPDGQWLATGDQHGSIRAWNAATGELRFTAYAHAGAVGMVRWSPSARRMASVAKDGIAIIDTATGALVRRIQAPGPVPNAIAWSPDGSRLAAGAREAPYVTVWQVDRPAEGTPLTGHSAAILELEWSPDGARLASASDDRSLRIWSATGAVEQVLDLGYGLGRPDLAWSLDGARIAAAAHDDLMVWEAATGNRLHAFPAHPDNYGVRVVGWWPDATRVATLGASDGHIRIWRIGDDDPAGVIRLGVLALLQDLIF